MESVITRFSRVTDCSSIKKLQTQRDLQSKILKFQILQKEVIVAKLKKEMIGVLKFEFLWTYQPLITHVFIDERYRRLGIGTKLVQYLEKYLIKKGYQYVFTSSYEDIKDPHKWYEIQEFKPCGVVDKINLPDSTSKEIFFYKRLS